MIELIGKYASHEANNHGADGTVNKIWKSIVGAHKGEFPTIAECEPGTFNVLITNPDNYSPPDEKKYRCLSAIYWGRPHGHHISPVAKVTRINGVETEFWIYRGGHEDKPVLELLSKIRLASTLGIQPGQAITLIMEILPEGSPGMPEVPGASPDRKRIEN
ncbi:hypothetical protein JKG47_16205 [Acidithiobacillus sp. MC6.1]|nr:hypothetical protein [Acidithiobacillus sp. MC6.1]